MNLPSYNPEVHKQKPLLAIIVPCYNEQEILIDSSEKLSALLNELIGREVISGQSYFVLVDDGSKDSTWNMINDLAGQSSNIKGLKLAANVGHQRALLGGLLTFKDKADVLISIDADLQDDIRVIEEMLEKYKQGCDVVYGVRKERHTDTWFKKQTAFFFYRLMKKMKVNILHNHADYRLASRRVIENLSNYGEANLFLRGIFPTIGFSRSEVYYDRLERLAGESKYPLRKMLSFAWDGITSFSVHPLRLVTTLGFVVFGLSLALSVYVLISFFRGNVIAGWVSTVLPVYFLGGIQLLCIGIIGEYIGKIYTEVKQRPRYIVEKIVD